MGGGVVEDDFELCDGVFCAIADLNGNQIDVAKEHGLCRTVTLVWHSSGIIDNGGFQYLFEGDFRGDPGYRHTAAAYQTIGAKEAYGAFQDALALFPDSQLPADIDERLQIYQSCSPEERDGIDTRFSDAHDDIVHRLAEYIRAHKSTIHDYPFGNSTVP